MRMFLVILINLHWNQLHTQIPIHKLYAEHYIEKNNTYKFYWMQIIVHNFFV